MISDDSDKRLTPDQVLADIADYVDVYQVDSAEADRIARYCLLDSLGCAFEALNYPACRMLLGPVVPDTVVRHGARVPGTRFELDPVTAAFNIGTMIRWLDSNDTFLAAERGHPSDNLGGILAVADYVSRRNRAAGTPPLLMRDVLTAMIKAYEIQGGIALENSFTRLGFDHAILVRVASAAVVTKLLGGNRAQVINTVSNAWADGFPTKAYRQAPNIGSRKSWAAGDATARATNLALMSLKGEMGYPTILTAKTYGIYDALYRGNPFTFQRPFGTYIMEHILFKFVPAEMMTQTAVECAFILHPQVVDRLQDIARIDIFTTEAAMGIVVKAGPLQNPADRDHCIQYVVAVGLIHGALTGEHFEDDVAADPRIDALREKMTVAEDSQYTVDFYAVDKRSSANRIQVTFKDGSMTPAIEVEYPMGHPRRRAEGLDMVQKRFEANLAAHFPAAQAAEILALCNDAARLAATPVDAFLDRLVV